MPRGIPKSGARVNRAAERRALRPTVIDPNQFYNAEEVAAFRDQCRARVYEEIRVGKIRSVTRGTRRLVLGAEIIRVNQEEAGQAT
jgi:hypothetical protein